ncbi:MAG: response regulator transcription factor [Sphingomicrobium sp.]
MARILLVDDDPVSSRLLCDLLLDAGHAVGWLSDGAEALAVMKRRAPLLAILDCAMPGLSGVHVLMAMRNHPSLCSVPVLMLTARQSERDEGIAYGAGADDYLRKPVDPDRLLGRIDALLLEPPGAQLGMAV